MFCLRCYEFDLCSMRIIVKKTMRKLFSNVQILIWKSLFWNSVIYVRTCSTMFKKRRKNSIRGASSRWYYLSIAAWWLAVVGTGCAVGRECRRYGGEWKNHHRRSQFSNKCLCAWIRSVPHRGVPCGLKKKTVITFVQFSFFRVRGVNIVTTFLYFRFADFVHTILEKRFCLVSVRRWTVFGDCRLGCIIILWITDTVIAATDEKLMWSTVKGTNCLLKLLLLL